MESAVAEITNFQTPVKTALTVNKIPIYNSIINQAIQEATGLANFRDNIVPDFTFIRSTYLDKISPEFLKKADITVAKTKPFQKFLKSVFNSEIVEEAGKQVVKGDSLGGKILADAAGRIPLLSLAAGAAFEVDDMYKASQKSPGELLKQSLKSSMKVGSSAVVSSTAGSIAYRIAPEKFKTLTSVSAGILSAMATDSAINKGFKAIEKIFGQNNKKN
jgi:hypothetical protein